ncbi:hypothetical protein Mkiyose1665_44960 [Mycobacterium kiyosense]|uniref:Uncharacterized protein n=1 Tax=Mycobacterium kiyosense TaxID=2871094 RepID=A0A9P3QDF1_9MYCO|nr:hypothetical protein IWGMT90018_04770 [Mycobacterium kiyosense]BDE11870.1 hypothetical protein MKCMC460_07300 [Mycobacterium sp. 20KCMC460]GLB84895.1 hypothetical protein SRL2020028_41510 [Mycobacterium kiyosense]GLB93071.1 hypothetical protein SRL2020130_58880 [Mycobacterium kiyosense]GLB99220.1 hypothetical protein SRL2020226_59960 [Mycobacterium kiyosense]
MSPGHADWHKPILTITRLGPKQTNFHSNSDEIIQTVSCGSSTLHLIRPSAGIFCGMASVSVLPEPSDGDRPPGHDKRQVSTLTAAHPPESWPIMRATMEE